MDRFKVCTCGKRYTVKEWRQLPRCGSVVDIEQSHPASAGEDEIPPFELRTCSRCGSTVSKAVPYSGGSDYPPPMPPKLRK